MLQQRMLWILITKYLTIGIFHISSRVKRPDQPLRLNPVAEVTAMIKRLNTEHRSYSGDPGACAGSSCPVVYELTHDPQTVRVQGLRVADTANQESFDPSTEAAVEIPVAVLLEAAQKLASRI